MAKLLIANGAEDKARSRLKEIIEQHPGSEPAKQARALLDKLPARKPDATKRQ